MPPLLTWGPTATVGIVATIMIVLYPVRDPCGYLISTVLTGPTRNPGQKLVCVPVSDQLYLALQNV